MTAAARGQDRQEIDLLVRRVVAERAQTTEEMIPVVYQELRQLAALLLSSEKPGQTLQPTALVHEAYLRLAGSGPSSWDNRRQFFGAAARTMRRILIDTARRKKATRHGGHLHRTALDADALAENPPPADLLDLDTALEELEAADPKRAELVQLRYFIGLSIPQTSRLLGISESTVKQQWSQARAWLYHRLREPGLDQQRPGSRRA